MNGSHLVKISRRRGTKYTFTIKRNITIVRGDSGTGKTTLFDMVADTCERASSRAFPCNAIVPVSP